MHQGSNGCAVPVRAAQARLVQETNDLSDRSWLFLQIVETEGTALLPPHIRPGDEYLMVQNGS